VLGARTREVEQRGDADAGGQIFKKVGLRIYTEKDTERK
jgi:hypothetical protein